MARMLKEKCDDIEKCDFTILILKLWLKSDKKKPYWKCNFSFFIVCEPRDVLVGRNELLSSSIKVLTESYQLSIESLVTLHNSYLR